MQQLLNEGDRLTGIIVPGPQHYRVGGKSGVISIGVRELPGPMGMYLVANIIFEGDREDLIVPLHSALEIYVNNPA